MKFFAEKRQEVMSHIEPMMLAKLPEYLIPIDKNWQPTDYLPDTGTDTFLSELKELQEGAAGLPYDLFAVLIGDTITEEALPTYSSWLSMVAGTSGDHLGGWFKWVRQWTAEENRHGDLLNRYLYLSGRVNMRLVESSTQYLIADGFDIGTSTDPYRNFVYTSFQELATNISHRRVGTLAKKFGDLKLSKMCGLIAADEARHAKAYKHFFANIIEVDPNGALLAFEDMMRKKIIMPAHFLRELGGAVGEAYIHFSNAAQRVGVYTATDYAAILKSLVEEWQIESLQYLNDEAEKARDYLIKLTDRLPKIAERMKPASLDYKFNWIRG